MMTFDEKVTKLADKITEGGYTRLHKFISNMSEEDLNRKLDIHSCAICDREYYGSQLDNFDRCLYCAKEEDELQKGIKQ